MVEYFVQIQLSLALANCISFNWFHSSCQVSFSWIESIELHPILRSSHSHRKPISVSMKIPSIPVENFSAAPQLSFIWIRSISPCRSFVLPDQKKNTTNNVIELSIRHSNGQPQLFRGHFHRVYMDHNHSRHGSVITAVQNDTIYAQCA